MRTYVYDLPQWFHVFATSLTYKYIKTSVCTCYHESSRARQHSNWNCVGANEPHHMHMDNHMVCVIELVLATTKFEFESAN